LRSADGHNASLSGLVEDRLNPCVNYLDVYFFQGIVMKKIAVLFVLALVAFGAIADELHNKAMAATNDLQQAIREMHVLQQEHGEEFGGHMARAEQLAQEAEQEREAAVRYYRERHPGWQ
jgi:hypothetical protein